MTEQPQSHQRKTKVTGEEEIANNGHRKARAQEAQNVRSSTMTRVEKMERRQAKRGRERECHAIMCKEAPLSTTYILSFDFIIGLGLDVFAPSVEEQPLNSFVLSTSQRQPAPKSEVSDRTVTNPSKEERQLLWYTYKRGSFFKKKGIATTGIVPSSMSAKMIVHRAPDVSENQTKRVRA